eukprot:CAMPEP_0116936854 /NCGR_PEP_ID=MMETSP0467-20121206/31141_1 /TAXON_ID=283647 /ORGANISM="Mesodinium pulex, Strain SPMC105" /LENGTH=100 /DNA_ID=CAMNT_0004618527 /DNA_START=598 /DNA_END=900 /DNA_ORIENTATION=-
MKNFNSVSREDLMKRSVHRSSHKVKKELNLDNKKELEAYLKHEEQKPNIDESTDKLVSSFEVKNENQKFDNYKNDLVDAGQNSDERLESRFKTKVHKGSD